MSSEKVKQAIESEYRRHFVSGDNTMQNVQLSDDVSVKVEVKEQQAEDMDIPTNAGRPLDSASGGDGSDTTQESASGSRAGARHFIKKPLNALERKKNEKERKARQMRRLRKWLMPKNAIVALHELQGPGMAEFIVNTNGQETKAEIVINNVKYEATAPNKNLAKAKASEKALRDLIFAQMTRLRQQQQTVQQTQPAAGSSTADTVDGEAVMTEPMDCIETEDLPMEHLASFALHKLFTQWEAEGFEVPFIKTSRARATTAQAQAGSAENGAGTSVMPKVTKTVADLPANAGSRHPTALFAYMRPQIAYEDLGSKNEQQNREFVAGLKTDGRYFIGKGRSKKLARKAAAIEACNELFGVVFDKSVLNA